MIDDETFELHYKQYRRSVVQFFSGQGFSREEAGDLTQEVFLCVYKNKSQFRGEASFRTWTYKVASNIWKNRVRGDQTDKRRAVVEPFDEFHAGNRNKQGSEQPLADLMQQERRRRIRKAIEQFPEQMRHCTILRIYHELKYCEIATVLKISVETVKTQLHLGRERLVQDLSESEP